MNKLNGKKLFIYDEIDNDFSEILAEISNIEFNHRGDDFYIELASEGGYTSYATSLYFMFKSFPNNVTINTFVPQFAYSCAALIFLLGIERAIAPWANVIFHHCNFQSYIYSAQSHKNINKIYETAREFQNCLIKNVCPDLLDHPEFHLLDTHEGLHLNAEECLKYGVATKIRD